MVTLNVAKRGILRHFFFWLLYLAWQSYAEYLFNFRSGESLTLTQKIWASVTVEACLLPVKFVLCYPSVHLINQALSNSQDNQRTWIQVVKIVLLLIVSILAQRWVSNYIAYPLALHERVDVPFWGPSYLTNSAIDMIVVFGLFNFMNFFELRSVLVRDREIVRQQKLEAELHFLRSQINPHFLFNTLNNIYIKKKNHQQEAPSAIHKLAGLLRFLLYDSNQELIAFDQELKFIHDYLELEKLRYRKNKLELIIELPASSSQPIAPMLLLPILENAFKHGSSESQHQAFIHIHIKLEGAQLTAQVVNSYESKETKEQAGIGLENLNKRLHLLYRDYQLDIKDQDQQFSVFLRINLNSYASTKLSHP